jgi:hypothetical protein
LTANMPIFVARNALHVSPDTKISGSDRWGIARTDASRALVAYNEYDGRSGVGVSQMYTALLRMAKARRKGVRDKVYRRVLCRRW